MLDINSFMVGGVALIPLVFGQVEFIKNMFDWEGKKVTALSAGLGLFWALAYQGLELVPEPYNAYAVMVIVSLAVGLSASGFYKFIDKRTAK